MGWFDNIGKGSVTEARATVAETMDKLEPMLHALEMRAAGILNTLVDRLGGMEITIKIHIPKAGADWEKTPPK
jgi:hypothetical protein